MDDSLIVPNYTTYIPLYPGLAGTNGTNSTDCDSAETLEKYLTCVQGPKHLPLSIVVPLTVVYVLIFVTGVIGNIAVCVVIVRISSMHTATNYYLFNLAVSDLALLLLGLPNDLGVYWEQYPYPFGVACCKFRNYVSEMMSYTSVLTIVAFSVERYVAICHPLHSYRMSGLRRAVRIIAVLWIIALIAALPFAIFSKIYYIKWPRGSDIEVEESAFCSMFDKKYKIYECSFLLFFLLPMLFMIVLYARIGLKIGSRARPRHALGTALDEQRQHGQSRKAIIRMLASVVIAFFLCWAPFHAQRLFVLHGDKLDNYHKINEWFYYLTGVFYYFGSTVNPILYNVMSVKYRMAFKMTLCGSSSAQARSFREQSSFRDTSVHAVVGTENGAGAGSNGVNVDSNGDVTWQRSPSLCGNRICRQDTLNGSTPCSALAPRPPPLPSPPPLSPSSCVTPNGAWSASAPSLTPVSSEFQSPTGSSDLVVRLSPGGQPRRPRCFTVGRMPRRIWSRALRDTVRDSVPSERSPLAGPLLTTCNGAANMGNGPLASASGADVETCI